MESRSVSCAARRRTLISTSSGISTSFVLSTSPDIGALDPIVLIQQDGEAILAVVHGHHPALGYDPNRLAHEGREIGLCLGRGRGLLRIRVSRRAVGAAACHEGQAGQAEQRLAAIASTLHV